MLAGPNSSFAEFVTPFAAALYFRATDGLNGFELWKLQAGQSILVTNLNSAGDSFPKNLTVFENRLCFAADDGVHGWELWSFDGNSAALLADLNPSGDSFPEELTVLNGILYFVATTPETGYEIWQFDGQQITLAADVNPGANSSFPQLLISYRNQLLFRATEDGFSNWELWTLAPETAIPVRITAIDLMNDTVQLHWTAAAGTTNFVQISDTNATGPYADLSGPVVAPGNGTVTHTFLDSSAPTQQTSRFYRIIQDDRP